MLYSLTFSKIIEYLFPFEMITVVIKQVSDDAVIQPQSLIFPFKVKFLHLLVLGSTFFLLEIRLKLGCFAINYLL